MRARLFFSFLITICACGRAEVGLLDPTPRTRSDGDRSKDAGTNGGNPADAGRPVPKDAGFDPPPDAGTPIPGECRFDEDCFRFRGEPICQDGTFGRWSCCRECGGTCNLVCEIQPGCINDCDCEPFLACINGACQPADRRNLCCFSPMCPPGERCELPGGGEDFCPMMPPPPPPSRVGAPCFDGAECGPGGICIEEERGFPDGYCSQFCSRRRPCPPDGVCVETQEGGALCLDGCFSDAECRMGYGCTEIGADRPVCLPVPEGSTNPMGRPVGDPCERTNDCVTGLMCFGEDDGFPGGYCTLFNCDANMNTCPMGSQCYIFPQDNFSLCLAVCPQGGMRSTCREDYFCLGPAGQPGVCISN